ncbi:hypothetical protein [Frigoribacterium sp. PhB116]|uniref:hypothetical protein n=1 Tax=Frigoribacterium sp. PhB116 TaxID=2485174 RepID=UPI00106125BF|nr:hypothetical protein [Frigoribacterium sp. PhB116]TDT64427.1 hypothetical protein EDF20_1924 [Frigoribacterium sp. PhB116]
MNGSDGIDQTPTGSAAFDQQSMGAGPSLQDRLFDLLPADGSLKLNGELLRTLGGEKADFWAARDLLVEDGRAVRGRGRGGSTARVLDAAVVGDPLDASSKDQVAPRQSEESLYEPLRGVLLGDWQSEKGYDYLAVEDVSRAGRRLTGGKWTRPDLAAVEVQVFTYLPVKTLSVHTFEVKPSDMIDVTAVYEALAHRRAATHSYVLLHVPDDQQPPAALDAVITEARRHGIGVIVFADPANYETWDERVVADRVDPDPAAVDEFVRVQLPEAVRSKVEKAVR